ncbi:hypothetical protein A2641_03840 [Candidatus Nomurabacteria bacterium RIFCSPHIGHO2_01_FULL_37_25]|uniref:Uncharacterized protein n=1 Tax=Candidatus Nomurabacteria bacterium RIFCSPLOWO2_01_FULL_36_16 TaxID=1801767 RepID=A0A1F6WY63_9BACT|nr:MAG: hypothetical protein A2641_03840 [Candidatus Nomurabacteria bacterium RIFCSPHIGHO2_01_FULL_37_25]OGI75163.1 MAG: hypothetical protein A3D36_00995 [Candidatus Nomurabacteria bacterium RIFCSPHIGHO2_02_FULL_36_29]OGI86818.1 MAG: hypothetical protein A3A91_01205 [Candidatus Nomurabacteria bacterium RIFCSPLOWO2_01_FULL_36_16]OGI95296.1 MAG: hypothetical protein A3I84_01765 [Candidatus Nomurabacteria bacterium RIFCSPLOWO2_02_FULL_36_8]
MKNNITNNKEKGFIELIIIIIIALLLMKYFGLTITGILNYFHLTWPEILNWLKQALNWFKDLVYSVL